MANRVLRDHRFLCDHAPSLMDYETADLYMLLGHEIDTSGELCPGGREVTDDDLRLLLDDLRKQDAEAQQLEV